MDSFKKTLLSACIGFVLIWAYSNDTFATLSDVNFLDENLGRYMYSNCGWDTHLNKFICVHSVETGEENIGPCKLVCTLFDEVEL